MNTRIHRMLDKPLLLLGTAVLGAGVPTACGPKPEETPAAATPEPVETPVPEELFAAEEPMMRAAASIGGSFVISSPDFSATQTTYNIYTDTPSAEFTVKYTPPVSGTSSTVLRAVSAS